MAPSLRPPPPDHVPSHSVGDRTVTTPTTLAREGMDAATNAADMRVVAVIDALITIANDSGEVWSANSIRSQLPTASQGLVGSRVKAASMRRPVEMVAVGWERSTLPSTHAKPIAQWRGVGS